ncbi:MAG TPA: hypothetical protein VNK25_03710 [Candidatus Nitrosotenuis sp.]|nr:hypothetical protein [Candidatus Nitrosotenuis sp.]
MDETEKIQTHLLSVWKEEKKLFSKGRECMFFLTNKHIMFVTKTEANPNWWKAAVQRQILTLMKSSNTMLTHDGYDEKDLMVDLENEKNEEYSLDQVVDVESQEKTWGTVLILKLKTPEKEKRFQLSIVRDWVTYPVKDAVKFLKVDWTPVVTYIKDRIAK